MYIAFSREQSLVTKQITHITRKFALCQIVEQFSFLLILAIWKDVLGILPNSFQRKTTWLSYYCNILAQISFLPFQKLENICHKTKKGLIILIAKINNLKTLRVNKNKIIKTKISMF